MPEAKITKAKLLTQIDETLQSLNLIKSALQAEAHPKQADLAEYKKRYEALLKKK